MEIDICHICLDYINYNPNTLIKKCCEAFICNTCWLDIQRDSRLNQCPICKLRICNSNIETTNNIEVQVLNRPEPSFMNDYRHIIRKITMLFKWFLIGYIITVIIIFIFHYNKNQIISDIKYIGTYFWPLVMILGYSIVKLFEYCSGCSCQRWNN